MDVRDRDARPVRAVTREMKKQNANCKKKTQGDPAKDIFEIGKGIIRLYRILPDGKRAIVGFIFPEQWCIVGNVILM